MGEIARNSKAVGRCSSVGSSGLRVYNPPWPAGGVDVNSGNVSGRLPCRQDQVAAVGQQAAAAALAHVLINGRRARLVRILSGVGNRLPHPIAPRVIPPLRRRTRDMKEKSETEPADRVSPAPQADTGPQSRDLPSVTWLKGACRLDTMSLVIRHSEMRRHETLSRCCESKETPGGGLKTGKESEDRSNARRGLCGHGRLLLARRSGR